MKKIQYESKNYAEIDLGALVYNYEKLCEHVGRIDKNAKPICVVKANAYGHGAKECVRALSGAGADFFAVSDIGEALEVREVSPTSKILILGYIKPHNAPLLARYNIIQTVHSSEYASELDSALAREYGDENVKIDIHIKLDTGMSRLGFPTGKALCSSVGEIESVSRLPHLNVAGVFSHFACADEKSSALTERQIKDFCECADALRKKFPSIKTHLCNSAGSVRFGAAGQDYFRLGISLYGHKPSCEVYLDGLRPAMSLYSTVSQVHTLRKGEIVSYGATFCADRDMKIATVAMGYADGLLRTCGGGQLLLGGQKAQIIGRICMDQCIVCADGIDVKEGDRVTVYDKSGENTEALAARAGTISYELVCDVAPRVEKRYING